MKKLLIILLALCPAVFGQKSKLIISVSGNDVKEVPDILMDEVSYGLKNNDEYEILGNESFKAALKDGWNKGDIADKRIMELAQKEKADYLCLVKINSTKELGGKYVTAQIYDLKTMSRKDDKIGRRVINNFNDLPHMIEVISDAVADMIGSAKGNSVKASSGNAFTDPRDGKQYKMVEYHYEDFTDEEKKNAALYNIIPGYGSISIMDDWVGAVVQWAFTGIGVYMMVTASPECPADMDFKGSECYGHSSYEEPSLINSSSFVIGLLVTLSSPLLVSPIRVLSYKKPKPKIAYNNSGALDLVVLPTRNGNGMVYGFMYNRSF